MIGYTDGPENTWTSTERQIDNVRVLRFSPEDRSNVKKDELDMLIEHGILPVFVKNMPRFVMDDVQDGAA